MPAIDVEATERLRALFFGQAPVSPIDFEATQQLRLLLGV
jgi:hypothetical protein